MASSASSAAARDRATTTATASPTWRTSSTAIGGGSGCTMSSAAGQAHGRLPCMSATSRPLNAVTTPGSRSAALTSTPVIRAWASGLRRIARYSMPGRVMLSVHMVRPVMRRASSLRFRAAPTSALRPADGCSVTGMVSCPSSKHRVGGDLVGNLLGRPARVGRSRGGRTSGRAGVGGGLGWFGGGAAGTQRAGSVAHGPHDVLVPGAAAQVAFQALADLGVGGVGVVLKQVDRSHDHAGRAEPALQGVPVVEGLLDRVQGVVRTGEALDGGDVAAVGLHGEHGTALPADEPPVGVEYQNGARPAVAGVAPPPGADLAEPLPQMVDEQSTGFDVVVVAHAVNVDADPGHQGLRAWRFGAQPVRRPKWLQGRAAPAPSPRARLLSLPSPWRRRSSLRVAIKTNSS